ncbi:hypothetical protein GCM10007874_11480 [Labrys miyagiensis]|uniref:Uncharacterized protein n=1 Tax=Labrys miyagiensis TaxID=346912 RepID=A0ABQ6CIN5_9HYPH|nr:hypothetical protein [Labrys miyagiensis]GLS18132.1 hypothetical protein GCM10007874_11480 [Labrys miyagiensis]
MSKHIISAAAIGLPEASRRTALAGAAALLVTACLPRSAKAETPTQPEPIIALIERYRAGLRFFEDHASALGDPEFTALADATYRPPLEELRAWMSPIQTRAGALAALQFCSEDMVENDEIEVIGPLVNAALVYFKGETA